MSPARSRLLGAAVVLGLVAGAGAAVAIAKSLNPPPVLPGYWESTSQVNVLIPQKPTVTRKCLTAEQVQEWLTGPSNRHYSCTYDRRRVGDGRVSLGGVCRDKRGRTMDVAITGAYAPERFHLAASFHYRLSAGVAIPGSAVTDARRLSADCPADLPPGR